VNRITTRYLTNLQAKNVDDCPTICHHDVDIPYPCTTSCSWGLFEGVCPATCHKTVSAPYPCLETCFNGAIAEGHFIDFPTSNVPKAYRWTPKPRILHSTVYTIPNSSLSQDEINLTLYQGRLGLDYVNNSYNNAKAAILSITATLRAACSSCDSTIKSAISNLDDEYDSGAPASIATKDWW